MLRSLTLFLFTTLLAGNAALGQDEWPPEWLEGAWSLESRTITLNGIRPTFGVMEPLAYVFKREDQFICYDRSAYQTRIKGHTQKHQTHYAIFHRPMAKRRHQHVLIRQTQTGVELVTISTMPDDLGRLKIVNVLKPLAPNDSAKLAYRLATYGDGKNTTKAAATALQNLSDFRAVR